MALSKLARTLAYLVVLLGGLWTVLPLYWMLVTAFKTSGEVISNPPTLWPYQPSLAGFVEAWTSGGSGGVRDSTIIGFGTLVVSLALGLPAAYGISRFRTGGANLSFAILSFRFMPPVALTVGFYFIAAKLHMFDTHLALILVNSLASIPFVVWIMKGFIDEIPYTLEEAAQIDGAQWLQVMKDHILPLAAPGVVAVSVFALIFAWNEFLFATTLSGRFVHPLSSAIPGIALLSETGSDGMGVYETNWAAVSALGTMMIVPITLLSFYLQKHIVRGMTYGAVRH